MRRVQVEIHIRDGDTRSLRSFSSNFIPLHGESSIHESFKYSLIKMIEDLEEAERLARLNKQSVHRID